MSETLVRARRRWWPWVVVALPLAVAAGGAVWRHLRPAPEWERIKADIRARFPGVKQLSTADLAAWLADASRPVPILLDARSEEEFAVSHLPKARRAETQAIPEDLESSQPIVVYCSVGYRSSRLAERMQAVGFSSVYNLEGSIFEWVNQGHEVVRGETPVREVHPYDEQWGQLLDPVRRAKHSEKGK